MKNIFLLVFSVFWLFTNSSFGQELNSADFKTYSPSLDVYTNMDFEDYFINECELRYDESEEREVYSFMNYIDRLKNISDYEYYITILTNAAVRDSFLIQLDNKLKNKGYLGKTLIVFQNIENENRSVDDINKIEVDDYYGMEISAGEAYIYCDSLGLDKMISPLKAKWVLEENWEVPYLFNKKNKGQIFKIGQTVSQKCGQDEVEILCYYISKLFSEDLVAEYEDQLLSKLYSDTLYELRAKYNALETALEQSERNLKNTKKSLKKQMFQSGWSAKIYPFVLSNGSTRSTVLYSETPAKFKVDMTSFALRLDYVGSDKTKSKSNKRRKGSIAFKESVGLSIGYAQGSFRAYMDEGIDLYYEIERDTYSDLIEINDLKEEVSLTFNSLSFGGFFQGKLSNVNYRVRTDIPLMYSRSTNYLVRNGFTSYSRRYNGSDFIIGDIPQHGLQDDVSFGGMNGSLDSKLSVGWSMGAEIDYLFKDSRFGITGAFNFFLIPMKLSGIDSTGYVSEEMGNYSSLFQHGAYLKIPRLNFQLGLRYSF